MPPLVPVQFWMSRLILLCCSCVQADSNTARPAIVSVKRFIGILPLEMSRGSAALAQRLVQAHATGHRHIEAVHSPLHGDVHQLVTGLARERAHARAFGA